ncbi:Pantothenate precursors transporter PanS [Sporomusa carbonis]|uniref:bile acid:sodium symporter family protein n=1 Tax=Sporomusa carbonis TaxID=3076075 RepID=UPI003A70D6FC
MTLLERIIKFFGDYFAALVILAAALAFFNPAPFKVTAPYIPQLLGLVMLGMGLTLTRNDFAAVFERPRDVFVGVLLQFLIMPIVGYIIAGTMGINPELAAGFILVGCVPSGTASNVMTYLAKGDVALSVTVSSITTLVAPFITPYLFLALGGQYIPVNATALLIDILKIVLIPIIAGVVLRHLFGSVVQKLIKIVPLISVVAIIAIVAAVVAASAQRLASMAGIVIIGVMLHNLLGYLIAYLVANKLCGMSDYKSRAISFEVGMQNSGLGAALAMVHLSPVAALPSAVFSVWHNISGPMLAAWWSKRLPVEAGQAGMPSSR